MPIVTLKEILKNTKLQKYAVGMFDVHNLEMTRAAIEAAQELHAPVILAAAQVHFATKEKLEDIADIMVYCASRAEVPVALHFDHGTSEKLILWALHKGFSSVMYDGSLLPFDENVENTKKVVDLAQTFGASVEAELGHVGGSEGTEEYNKEFLYTDVFKAKEFAEKTKVDALAVSIGTVHGRYRDKPKLNFTLLESINEQVEIPLVLHGGSGLSDEDIVKCIERGIGKINVYTEIVETAQEILNKRPKELCYLNTMEKVQEGMKQRIRAKIKIFGSCKKDN